VSPRAGARQSWGCHCQDCQGPKKKVPRAVCFDTKDTKAHVDLGSQIPFPRAVHEDPQNGRAVDSVPGQCRCNSIGSPMWCGSWCPHQPSTSKCSFRFNKLQKT
jgi:hypothetical protein